MVVSNRPTVSGQARGLRRPGTHGLRRSATGSATGAVQSVWAAWVIVTIKPFEEAAAAVDVRLD